MASDKKNVWRNPFPVHSHLSLWQRPLRNVSAPQADIVQTMKHTAFWMMDQLRGWCTHDKANVLMDIVLNSKPDVIVEIGVFGGKSLIPMAYVLKALGNGIAYGIDPWEATESVQGLEDPINKSWWAQVDHFQILHSLTQKIHDFGLEKRIQLIQKTSMDAPLIQEIDILHIDGNHSEQSSYQDVLKWVPLVKKGGWIIFDDINWIENGRLTTAKATQWLDRNCTKFQEYSDSSAWGIWIK